MEENNNQNNEVVLENVGNNIGTGMTRLDPVELGASFVFLFGILCFFGLGTYMT